MQISFDARIKISTEMHCAHQYLSIDLKICSHQYLSIDPKNVCHAHSYAQMGYFCHPTLTPTNRENCHAHFNAHKLPTNFRAHSNAHNA